MSATWYGETPPPSEPSFGLLGWMRLVVKLPLLAILIFGGLAILIIMRLVERPVFGLHRPVTPALTVFVCRMTLRILGIKLSVVGALDARTSAVVANHSSWLDIFVLNAVKRVYFVSKSEVAGWPGIGWLAQATGTVFIERDRRQAAAQTQVFKDRLAAGHRLLFFPEGTSSDGRRVLPFKSTLFAAFYDPDLIDRAVLQPTSLRYDAPPGLDPRFFGWWGDMSFGGHFLSVVARGSGGQVTLTYHAPLAVSDFENRKALARACETAVRAGFQG